MDAILEKLNNPAILDFYNRIEDWFTALFEGWGIGNASMVAMIVMIVLCIALVLLTFYLVY